MRGAAANSGKSFPTNLERRAATEVRTSGRRLIGYAARFGAVSADLGGFRETVAAGAFRRALDARPDVVALWDHDRRAVLGRTTAGTLRLAEDADGLAFTIDVADTTAGRDALESVGRGDVTGASFAFEARGEEWSERDGLPFRTLTDVDLHDVTVTPTPAYPDASVARRSLERRAPVRLMLARRYLDLLEAAPWAS